MDETKIRKIVQDVLTNSQYKVGTVQFHTHNGIDSPLIKSSSSSSTTTASSYGGRVNADGTAGLLPSGWTSAKVGTGKYTITHHLNTSNYSVVCGGGPITTFDDFFFNVYSIDTNSFTILDVEAGSSPADQQFCFILTLIS